MRATTTLFLGICLLTVGLAGCVTPGQTPGPGPIPFETIAKGQSSDVTDRRTVVVRDIGTWADLWTEHHPGEPDGSIGVPNINFSERMVVAVFQGEQPNICYGAEIETLNLTDGGQLIVEGTWYVPAEDAVCGEALTQPFHIVETASLDAEVVFEMTERTRGGQADEDPADDPDDPAPSNLTLETVEKGGDSGIETRQERVIRDNATWQQLWENHTAGHSDPPPAPAVDFSERMVLAIFKGQSPDGCHRAEIREVTEADNGSYVVDGAYFKAEAAACTLAITYPFHMVTVPADEDPVVFQMTDRAGEGSQDEQEGNGAGNVTWSTLDRGSQSGVEDQRQVAIHDQVAWEQLWENHTEGQQPAPDRPEVDFSTEIVVAIFKGQSPDGCHGAEITNVTRDTATNGSTDLIVEGSYYKAVGDVACSQGITYPFHIVKVQAQPDDVAFAIGEGERQA